MKEKTIKTPYSIILFVILFLLPLIIVPFIINPLENSKILLTLLTAFITIFAYIFSSFKKKEWKLVISPISISLLLFAGFSLISSLVSHQYPIKELLGIGGIYLSFASIIFFAPSLIKENLSKKLVFTLNLTAIILSVISILQLFGLGLGELINKISILNFPNNLSFSLTGSTFIAIQFLSVVLIANIFDKNNSSWLRKISIIAILISLAANIWAIIPGNEAAFKSLSLRASLNIARQSLGVSKTALFGYGPDSYDNAYNILKPVWINGQNYWQFVFDSAFNLPLTMLVTAGSLALITWLIFTWKTFTLVSKKTVQEKSLAALIISIIIWQFLAPVNILMLAILAISIAVFIAANKNQYRELSLDFHRFLQPLNFKKEIRLQKQIFNFISLILLGGLSFLFFNFSKAFLAYGELYRSNQAAQNNEIVKAYEHQKNARNLSDKLDYLRRTYSLINLEIAIALSNKAELNAAEQDQVLQLVNQAIREAKAATILDPQNYQNWLTVAEIYLQLLDTTPQAQQEAFDALAKAVSYNPNNPDLRMKLGQLFFSMEQYQEASNFFIQAIERKPDLARAYYALAKSYQAAQLLEDAENALVQTLSLLEPETEDYLKVEIELEEITAQIEANKNQNTRNSETTTPPSQNELELSEENQNDGEIESNLSELLGQKETEQVIQNEALNTDQETIEN